MSWLDKILPPKIKNRSSSSSVPEGLWHKCPSCSATVYSTELKQNSEVCPKCNHHNPLSARERLNLLLDEEGREEIAANIKPTDPLKFKDSKKYPDRLVAARKATGEDDALVVMKGTMNGLPVVVAAFEFRFIGGSMGSVVGERFVQGVRRAVADNCSFICVAASGGARMQEGVNSLMQMTKTSAALHLLTEKTSAVYFRIDRPDHGRRICQLCLLGRCDFGRTECSDWFCRSARYRADCTRNPARRFPTCRIFVGEGRNRPNCRSSFHEKTYQRFDYFVAS